MKLFAKDRQSRGCVVSAWIVTGKNSKFIADSQLLARRLRAHMTSLCFDADKFQTKELQAAYIAPTTQTTTAPKPTTTSTPATGL